MHKKTTHIPVNTMPAGIREGIFIRRSDADGPTRVKEVERSHRDSGHLFILQEKGATHIEIDFQQHRIAAPAVIYIHPDQVHRVIGFAQATTSSWLITGENLQPELLKLLNDLAPVSALELTFDTLGLIAGAASLCIELAERKKEKLYEFLLKESCNTLTALVASQYLAQVPASDQRSRFEVVTHLFKAALERQYKTVKSPRDYADLLNIAAPYLNECVRTATGHSVSHHIQQRVVLEAKRLLYHSSQLVKEIAAGLGYDDYSYFIRLFTKVAGMTPLAFRNKNFD